MGLKLPVDNGRLMRVFSESQELIRSSKEIEGMEFVTPLKGASKMVTELTMTLAMKGMGDPEEAGAIASNYLNVFAPAAMRLLVSSGAARPCSQGGVRPS